MNHQIAIRIWRIPPWIRDGKLNTLVIFCFYGCWFSGFGFIILEFFQFHQILKNECNFTQRWFEDFGNTSLEQSLRLKTLGYLLFIPNIFYLMFGWPIANFWLSLRKKSHSPNASHCIWTNYFLSERDWEGLAPWT